MHLHNGLMLGKLPKQLTILSSFTCKI